MRLWVEPWPSGGYAVRVEGAATPLSRHDTEEEALERIAAYERGLARRDADQADHVALGALDPATGEGLGVARYVRDPGRPDTAEAAVAVIDAWQGRGLGSVLLRRLCARAAEHGITTFSASLFTANHAMLRAFQRLGEVHVRALDAGAMAIDVELPVGGSGMRAALRSAATGHVGRDAA